MVRPCRIALLPATPGSPGYAAMMSNDWRRVTIITLLGGVAGLVAAWFAQRAR
jgi:hypothetical protein